ATAGRPHSCPAIGGVPMRLVPKFDCAELRPHACPVKYFQAIRRILQYETIDSTRRRWAARSQKMSMIRLSPKNGPPPPAKYCHLKIAPTVACFESNSR